MNDLHPDTLRGAWRVLVAAWRNFTDWHAPTDFALLLLPILWTGAQILGIVAVFALIVGGSRDRSIWAGIARGAATGAVGLVGLLALQWVLGMLERAHPPPPPPPSPPATSSAPDLPARRAAASNVDVNPD